MTIPPATEAPDLDALPNEEKKNSPMKNYTDEDLPPLRLNATRVPERLSSSTSALSSLSHIRRRSNEWSKPRSRSRSPSMRDPENSSVSSIDTDSDIYTDRMGLEELDAEKMHKSTADGSITSLPPVHERMSEDMLEDVHAFSDISKQSSRANSVATCGEMGSLVLETLDECDDEDHDAVHISNLDHIHEESEHPNLDDLPDDDEQQPPGQTYFFTTEDLPPLRLNACRVPDKFSHSVSSFFDSSNRRTGLPDNLTSKSKTNDYNSNSSFEGLDHDILTDRMAFQEMEKTSLSTSVSSLQAVNERMESDTLDDVHAFSDVLSKASSSGRSGANSIATGGDVGSLLETLDEGEEDDDDHDPEDGGVHISNLENLTIHDDANNNSTSIGINKSSDATT